MCAQVTIPNRPSGTDQRAIASILADFDAITTQINGNLDSTNLAASLAQSSSVNQAGQTVKGVSILATPQVIATGAYVSALPSVVVVLPTNGLIEVLYQATWQESVAGAARAAIFIGANQFRVPILIGGGPAAYTSAAMIDVNAAGTNLPVPLSSFPGGLISMKQVSGGTGYGGDVTTGQGIASYAPGNQEMELNGIVTAVTPGFVGGPCYIDNLPAGTYGVGVQAKASSGSVTLSNQRLKVRAISFA